MADKIDLSLDEIIKTKRGGARGRGRGRNLRNRGGLGINKSSRGSMRGLKRNGMQNRPMTRRNSSEKWQHDLFNTSNTSISPRRGNIRPNNVILSGATTLALAGGPGKLLISNLDFGVTDSDIQELFGEFGPLLSAAVHYDRTGRSLGTADVVFERRMDGIQAIKKYNNVPLDGRPMNIQMATSDISLASPTIVTNGSNFRMNGNMGRNNVTNKRIGNGTIRGRGRRGGFRGGRGGRNQRGGGPKPTAAQLDAELDTYNSQMES